MSSEGDGLDRDLPDSKGGEGASSSPKAEAGDKRVDLIPIAAWSPPRFERLKYGYGTVAAGVAVVLGAGFVAGTHLLTAHSAQIAAQTAPPAETTAALIHHVEDEVRSLKVGLDALRANADNTKQDEAIRGLRKSVDVLKQDLETAKAANTGGVAQINAKLDKLDRDPTPKLAEISARLDRIDREPGPKLADIAARLDKLDREPTPRLAEITARLDRIERQVSSAVPTGSIGSVARAVAPTPASTPVPAVDREPQRPPTIEGWMLRDVYDGVALVEGRAGGLREVRPGAFIPGVGEVRSIERRGRSWVVVTSRGLIVADSRW